MPPKKPASGQAPAATPSSISYSKARYAHPFFVAAPGAEGGSAALAAWNKQHLGTIPPLNRKGPINLSAIISDEGVKEIEDVGEIRFHALGDTGVGSAEEARVIAEEMATDFKVGAGGLNPAFLFHLGDVIYGNDKAAHYGERFYTPYKDYPGKILAIPGNHDGETKTPADEPSLSAFEANFCALTASVPPQASGSGIYRETMTQPGVYWLLDAPFVRIIGLYSNLNENQGYLEGAAGDTAQLDWLTATLSSLAKAKEKKALIIATHHPPYSQSGHVGSAEMNQSIDDACTKAGAFPDLFLSGHSHNYQRYTRRVAGKQIPYVVVGTGGMPVQPVVPATGQPAGANQQVTYDAAVSSYGYLFVTGSAKQLAVQFWQYGAQHIQPFDQFAIDLAAHTVN